MADEYDPLDPPTYSAAEESYDPSDRNDDQDDGAEEDDDYDPSSVHFDDNTDPHVRVSVQPDEAQADTTAPPDPAPPKTHKVAGFIIEESDEEQDTQAPPPSQLNGTRGALSGLGAEAASEAQDVSLHSAPQDTAAPSISLNASTSVSNAPASTSVTPLPTSSLQHPPADQGKTVSPVTSAVQTPQPAASTIVVAPPTPIQRNGSKVAPPARLPHDKVGQLEDRIKEDPKGDVGAWIGLIDHYSNKQQFDFARNVYKRFFKVFPMAVSMWIKYTQMENGEDEGNRVVAIFNEVLMQVPSVELWKMYLDHVRRALPLLNDTNGQNRSQISAAFDITLDKVGVDPEAGVLWRDYIDFLKDGPGTVGGQSWQDLQKVDILRKAYQRAIKLPHSEFVRLWKEYETFEMSLHKTTGRKHIQEQSPHYMQARTAKMQLDQKLEGLERLSLPRLPPMYDCAGEDEFATQVEKWRAWIDWEKNEDPLVYVGTETEAWQKRVLFVYTQATMALYFYPQIWFEAASWCFKQNNENMSKDGEQFLEKGINANPESVLLALMKADRVESSLESGNTDEVLIRNGEKLDVPYETVHTALYALRDKQTEKDKRALLHIKQHFANLDPEDEPAQQDVGNDSDDESRGKPKTRAEEEAAQIAAVKATSAPYLDTLKRVISYMWVAKMQAFRRVQGQGKPAKKGDESKSAVVKGFRGIFGDARPRGFLSSDVYTASALMEWHCYRDPSAIKIFERGMKLFPEDETFILEYIKHLVAENDVTNARVVFESTVPKIASNAKLSQEQKKEKLRPLFGFMYDYESKYGDLAQTHKLGRRMAELYPDESDIDRFANRFVLSSIDAIHVQILLSPTQAQPRPLYSQTQNSFQTHPSVEMAASPRAPEILLGPSGPYVASPKRPLDDSDSETPQRKFLRAESPLKGAAGMRVQSAAKAFAVAGAGAGGGGFATKTFVPTHGSMPIGPAPLPSVVDAILGQLPSPASYTVAQLDAVKLVQFLSFVNIDHARGLFAAGQLQRR